MFFYTWRFLLAFLRFTDITDFLNNFLKAFKDLMNGKCNEVIWYFIVFDMKC
jgi:hypothetical protein